MKKITFLLPVLLIAFIGCKDDDDNTNPPDTIQGEYAGTFERDGNTSNVELTFSNGKFEGESNLEKFPALCKGTYTISGDTITFIDLCSWTTEFDMTLILTGDWHYTFNSNMLVLSKFNGDTYKLTNKN
ncbi:MAG: hypothetical protein PF489_15405 [Salinivirgaceae bacterium]|jgi:hypothetical protein|nr:hypothetical protein [Salinivirgaceae bacterium]